MCIRDRLPESDLRAHFRVLLDHLDLSAGDLVTDLVKVQIHAVGDAFTQYSIDRRVGQEHPNFERLTRCLGPGCGGLLFATRVLGPGILHDLGGRRLILRAFASTRGEKAAESQRQHERAYKYQIETTTN